MCTQALLRTQRIYATRTHQCMVDTMDVCQLFLNLGRTIAPKRFSEHGSAQTHAASKHNLPGTNDCAVLRGDN